MNKEQSLQELETEIQKVIDADTNDLLELAKILGYNLLTDFAEANLRGVDVNSAELIGADFRDVDFSNANLSNANLSNANLSNANLSNANLSNANLSNANLSNANLSHANLTNSNLRQANLSYANLRNANHLTAADIEDAIFEGSIASFGYWVRAAIITNYLSYGESCGKSDDANLRDAKQIIATFKSGEKFSDDFVAETEQLAKFIMEKRKTEREEKVNSIESYKEYLEKCLPLDKEGRLSEFNYKIEQSFNRFINQTDNENTVELERLGNFVLTKVKENKEVVISELFKKYLENSSSPDEASRIFEYRYEIEELEKSFKACEEASLWLSQNRSELITQIRKLILENQLIIENSNRVEIYNELADRFCESINIYLLWIENFIANGEEPTPLPEGVINLALPNDYYVKVFEYIKNQKFSLENGLSERAIRELTGYFDRFLINTLK
ncbi:MAG: pentapeptide repeat-containing protein [Rivularia sp. (in: Bacteria)]|nr:pentapeptide repeat-containing protein [Rivularia sp. MS3]